MDPSRGMLVIRAKKRFLTFAIRVPELVEAFGRHPGFAR
jgi:hypothetical protein